MPILLKPYWVKHDGDAAIYSIDVHPDNTRFATAGADGRIRIWNMHPILEPDKEEQLPKQLCLIVGHESSVTCVRWSPNGIFLASASNDACVGISNRRMDEPNKPLGSSETALENWKFKHILRGHNIDVWDLAWSPDSKKIASAGHNGKIIIWDISQNGKMIATLESHTSIVKGLAWDPIGRYLASQEDTSVIFWRTDNWKVSKIITESFTNASESPIFKRLSWSPDGGMVIAVSGIKSKRNIAPQIIRESWDYTKCELVGHNTPVTVVHFNPVLFATKNQPTSCCASSSLDGTVGLWLTSRNRAFAVLKNIFFRPLSDLRWSSNGDVLLMSSLDGTISACIFGPRELGRKLTPEQHRKHIKEIFGDVSSPAKLIESPDLLKLYQTQKDSKPPVQPANTTPCPPISIESRPYVSNKIERLPSGKQKIVPVCIKSQPFYTTESYYPPTTNNDLAADTTPEVVDGLHEKINCSPILSQNLDTPRDEPSAGGGDIVEETVDEINSTQGDENDENMELYGLAAISTPDRVESDKKRPRDGTDTEHESEDLKKRKKNEDFKKSAMGKKLSKRGSRPKSRSKSNADEVEGKGFSDQENLDYYSGSGGRFVESRIVLPIPNSEDRMVHKLMTSNTFFDGSTNDQFLEAFMVYEESSPTGILTTLSLVNGENVVWKEVIFNRIVLMTGNLDYFFAIATCSGEIFVYSTCGRRLLPPMILSSEGIACLESNGPYLLAASIYGRVCLWDVVSCIIQMETNIETLFNRMEGDDTAGNRDEKNAIEKFLITDQGQALAMLKNGKTFAYYQLMACWCCIYDLSWQRKMNLVAVGDGPLGKIQKEVNKNFDIPTLASYTFKSDPSNEQALNVSHLETQIASSLLLGDSDEYHWWLTQYATKLVQLVNGRKLNEIGNWLLGTTNNRSGEKEDWDPYVLGLSKKKLLSEILLIMTKEPELQRFVSNLDSLLKMV